MTDPVPSGNLNALPAVRELSNCLPLLSVADASYNHPVYSTTAICPPPTAAPVPGLSVSDCSAVTALAGGGAAPVGALAGGAPDLPVQAASSASIAMGPALRIAMDAMAGILKHFLPPRSQAAVRSSATHRAQAATLPATLKPLKPMAYSRNAPTASSSSSTACNIHSIGRQCKRPHKLRP